MINGSRPPSWHSEGIALGQALGRIEAKVDHLSDRVDGLEERPPPQPPLTLRDIAPYIWGALVLLAAATGRITWGQAVGLLGSGG